MHTCWVVFSQAILIIKTAVQQSLQLRCNLSATEKNDNCREYTQDLAKFYKGCIIMSHQKYFEHAQKTSCNWFWSSTSCEGFLGAAYQSNHGTVADRSPISRRPISWIISSTLSMAKRRPVADILQSQLKQKLCCLSGKQSFCNMGHKGGQNRQYHQSGW